MMMMMVMRSPARRSSAMRAISETCWSPEDYTKCFLAKSIRRRKVGSEDRKEELPQVDILEVGLFVKVRGCWLLRPLRIGMPETITSSSCIVGTFWRNLSYFTLFSKLSVTRWLVFQEDLYLIHLKLLHLFVQASVEQVDEVEELRAENIHGGQFISPTPKSILKFKYCYRIWVIKAVAIANF